METGTKPSSTFDQKLTDSKAFIKLVDVAEPSSFGRELAKIIFGVDENCLLVEFVLGQNSVGNPVSDVYSSLEKMFVNVVSDRFPDDTEYCLRRALEAANQVGRDFRKQLLLHSLYQNRFL